MADRCPVCKIDGDHKLSCPGRNDGQMRFGATGSPATGTPQMPALPSPALWGRRPPPDWPFPKVGYYDAEQMHAFRAEGVREAQLWRSMDTAPKDGTNVLLVNRAGNMAAGLWMDSRASGPGWYLRGGDRPDAFFNGSYGPTHWMPLPPLPAAEIQPPQKAGTD